MNKGVSEIYEWLEFNALTERNCACDCNGERISGLVICHLVQYGGATIGANISVCNALFTVCVQLRIFTPENTENKLNKKFDIVNKLL